MEPSVGFVDELPRGRTGLTIDVQGRHRSGAVSELGAEHSPSRYARRSPTRASVRQSFSGLQRLASLPSPPFLLGEHVVFPRMTRETDHHPAFLRAPWNKALKRQVLVAVTNYRVLFLGHDSEGMEQYAKAVIEHTAGLRETVPPTPPALAGAMVDDLFCWTPLLNVEAVVADASRDPPIVEIFGKDMSVYNVQGMTRDYVQDLAQVITDHPRSVSQYMCFEDEEAAADVPPFDIARELHRWTFSCGDPSYARRWRLSDANRGYSECPSYGERVVVPTDLTDDNIRDVAKFRKRNRFPIVSWVHPTNGACLARCSQPEIGVIGKESADDQKNILKYAADDPSRQLRDEPTARPTTPSKTGLLTRTLAEAGRIATMRGSMRVPKMSNCLTIVDARGEAAAGANRARGGGTEKAGYDGCSLVFLNIGNIHAMRDSMRNLRTAVSMKQSGIGTGEWKGFSQQCEKSLWFGHLELIIKGARFIASKVHEEGESVVIHCSDGWDRTTQLAGIASVLLDPHYRTIDGFPDLIAKDWMLPGHKFQDRIGLSPSAARHRDEESPIFMQFCDCLCHLWDCYPTHFEYTPQFIAFVNLHAHSGRFGNFLCNNEQDRATLQREAGRSSADLWAHIASRLSDAGDNVAAKWRNGLYRPEATRHPLIPDRVVRPEQYRWQEVLYGRWRAIFDKERHSVSSGALCATVSQLLRENMRLRALLVEAGMNPGLPLPCDLLDPPAAALIDDLDSSQIIEAEAQTPSHGRRCVDAHGRALTLGCALCGAKFHKLTQRKQTCRICGKTVCADCSRSKVPRGKELVRMCDGCVGGSGLDVCRAESVSQKASRMASCGAVSAASSDEVAVSKESMNTQPHPNPLGISHSSVTILTDYFVEEVWQNQRKYPGGGWSCSLLPTDRPAWSSRDGKYTPLHTIGLPADWEWVDEWRVENSDKTGGDWDPPGWEYAMEFGDGREWSDCESMVRVVRRRKWARTRRSILGSSTHVVAALSTPPPAAAATNHSFVLAT
eukprot:TRINITY_DN43900_c0_g1_i1.p1 TRINITY_DN43900_c0_g1~~TRINITY_DN43900_c0_g1_i1.p1  ORF type:complete len:1010 (+),score=232.93 TRINITY_DN43900_c0_g1_i1:117-3146(+)